MSRFYCTGCGTPMSERVLRRTASYDDGNGQPTYCTWKRYKCPHFKWWKVLWTRHRNVLTRHFGRES